MTPKKNTVEKKLIPFPREILYTKEFVNDWEKIGRSGKHDMNRIKEVISLLVKNDAPLPPEWKDHKLNGEWKEFRECHVKGDLLVVYQIHRKSYCEVLIFTSIGTHSEIFG